MIKTQHKFAIHLSLIMLTRKTELLHATWDCVDFERKTFTIKESKMDNQLLLPLPSQAVTMFEILRTLSSGSKYIFIGRSGVNQPISSTTLNWVLRPFNQNMFLENKANYFTIHDLRRTGATMLSEMNYPSDYIEYNKNYSIYKKKYDKALKIREKLFKKAYDLCMNDGLVNRYGVPVPKVYCIAGAADVYVMTNLVPEYNYKHNNALAILNSAPPETPPVKPNKPETVDCDSIYK